MNTVNRYYRVENKMQAIEDKRRQLSLEMEQYGKAVMAKFLKGQKEAKQGGKPQPSEEVYADTDWMPIRDCLLRMGIAEGREFRAYRIRVKRLRDRGQLEVRIMRSKSEVHQNLKVQHVRIADVRKSMEYYDNPNKNRKK